MTLHNEIDATTHRTPKALRAKCRQNLFRFAEALGVRARTRAAFTTTVPQKNQTNIDATIYGVVISVRHYALPQMRVA